MQGRCTLEPARGLQYPSVSEAEIPHSAFSSSLSLRAEGRISHFFLPLLLPALFTLGGCFNYIGSDGKQDLESASKSYSTGDNAAVIHYTDDFLSKYSRSDRADEAYYLRGVAKYNLAKSGEVGLYTAAVADLQQAFAVSDNPDLRPKAGFALGNASYDTGDLVIAERGYRGALVGSDKNPDLASQAYYRLGRTLQREGKWRDADLQFQKVIHGYNGSEAARAASVLINANAWAVQAGSFRKQEDAKKAADALSKRISMSAHAVVVLDGQPRYLVLVGRFGTYEEATGALHRVQAAKSDAFVTVTR